MPVSAPSAEYRVPKREIVAQIKLFGQPTKPYRLFLSERAETHLGVERPSDLLNETGSFFPAVEPSGEMALLRRDAVILVSVAAEQEFRDSGSDVPDLDAEPARAVPVEVVLADGTEIRGMISYLMPEGRSRLLDFLNTEDRFVRLRDANAAILVNKRHIVRVSTP